MQELLLEFQLMLTRVPSGYERYLFGQVDLSNRLVAIKGARGTGKTTLLLQLAQQKLDIQTTLYVSMEHIYFYDNKLYDLAKEFDQNGGTHLLLDEAHKYPNWSREIKLIYDSLPELSILFTSSSVLELHRSEADLSRRLISYHLKALSFREFIYFDTKIKLPPHSLDKVVENHTEIARNILQHLKPLPLFKKYLQYGAYPYYIEGESVYLQKLRRTIDLTIETDIAAVESMNYASLLNLKKLLKAIASSAPFTPNISKLSRHINLSRNQLVKAIKILERAGLLNALYRESTGIGSLTKPEKLYLNNTNLMYAIDSRQVDVGNVRETFFANQMRDVYDIHLSPKVDFLVDRRYSIEVGGKNKKQRQLAGLDNAFVAKDDIEIGIGNVIPLWLFGFCY
jgi:predicted AAA+ superfamily ATPase